MRGHALILLSLLLVPMLPPESMGAAAQGCLSVDPASFDELSDLGPLEGFPGWRAARGERADRMPMTPTFLAMAPGAACDLTHGLAAFLGPAAAPVLPRDAERLAHLALTAIHIDVFPDAVILDGSRVSALARGHLVEMQAWTPRGGVLVDARVRLDGDVRATFTVIATGVGAAEPFTEGRVLQDGMIEDGGHGPTSGGTAALTGPNADGTSWRVVYDPNTYVDVAEAEEHAARYLAAAQRAYANLTSWGFVAPDPDGVLTLTLDGCNCIYAGLDADIHVLRRARDILIAVPALEFRSEAELAEIIVGHELFHHVQYGIQGWRMGKWLLEGTARLVESLLVPDGAHLPGSMFYARSNLGVNGFVRDPSRSIGEHTYDWALVWGWLYAHEGGAPLLAAVLEESVFADPVDLDREGAALIDRAISRMPGAKHVDFAEAYTAFAEALLTREGWTWGPPGAGGVHDWAAFLDAPARDEREVVQYALPPWGIRIHDAEPAEPGVAVVISYTSTQADDARLFTRAGPDARVEPAQPIAVVGPADDAALLVVRSILSDVDPLTGPRTYAVTIIR